MSDRWTDATLSVVARVIGHSDGELTSEAYDLAADILAALADVGLLPPPDAEQRTEHGRVYQDGRLLPIEATRRIWETPWLPECIAGVSDDQ